MGNWMNSMSISHLTSALTALLEGTVRTATPLAFAALGETVVERSGVINIGLEGSIIMGALAGSIGSRIQWCLDGIRWSGIGRCRNSIALRVIYCHTTSRSDHHWYGSHITCYWADWDDIPRCIWKQWSRFDYPHDEGDSNPIACNYTNSRTCIFQTADYSIPDIPSCSSNLVVDVPNARWARATSHRQNTAMRSN